MVLLYLLASSGLLGSGSLNLASAVALLLSREGGSGLRNCWLRGSSGGDRRVRNTALHGRSSSGSNRCGGFGNLRLRSRLALKSLKLGEHGLVLESSKELKILAISRSSTVVEKPWMLPLLF